MIKREFRQAEVGVDDGSRPRASVDYYYRIGTLVVLEGSKNGTLLIVFKYFKSPCIICFDTPILIYPPINAHCLKFKVDDAC